MQNTTRIEEKLQELALQREAFISKIKRILDDNIREKKPSNQEGLLLAYLSSSYNLTTAHQEDNVIIGSLTIHNETPFPLQALSICLVIESGGEYQFYGKYSTENKGTKNKAVTSNWERMMHEDEPNHYWFQWIGEQPIAPQAKIQFSDFTISWMQERPFFCVVNAFVYTADEPTGIQAVNAINLRID